MKRVFIIVLDSVGAGELPDAAKFGDEGAHTLESLTKSAKLNIPNLRKLGIGNIDGLSFLGKADAPTGAYGKSIEVSAGKDTTIGHWEIAGLRTDSPLPTFPNGFPAEVLDEFSRLTGRGVLCNKPYSGTAVIAEYGEQHMKTGDLIVYTSADSVFQIAAHESIVPPEKLYEYCRMARSILVGKYGVGRVIARPFVGEAPNFTRTGNRHDFSLEPHGKTVLDAIKEQGKDVIAVGKITDIFAAKGITETLLSHSNAEGMAITYEVGKRDFDGLCFVNLVDFDSAFGHRRDVDGYANALTEFDTWLGGFMKLLGDDDALIITADHGCDPAFTKTTDHTREYIPIIAYGKNIKPVSLGVRKTYSDIAATVADMLSVKYDCGGTSFAPELIGYPTDDELCEIAKEAMMKAYAPYSGFYVGAALLAKDGSVYTGCNIENAAFTPTTCGERTAFFKAISEGKHTFVKIAVAGGDHGKIDDIFPPCGVCRQVMSEFCDPDKFEILMVKNGGYTKRILRDLLPYGFSPDYMK